MLAFAACVAAPSQTLVRLETEGLSIVSDAGEGSARPLIDRLLEMKLAFPMDYEAKLTVLVLSQGQRFERVRPARPATAFFQRSAGENYVVLRSPADVRPLRHEFVHFALDHSAVHLPLWLEEGLAEYYSTLVAEPDHLRVGGVIQEHLDYLRTRGVPRLTPTLLAKSNPGRETYAAGWALAHMLQHDAAYRARYGEFWRRIQLGEESVGALTEAFGRTLPRIENDLEAYVSRPALGDTKIGLRHAIDAPRQVVTTKLSADDFDDHYVALARAMDRPDVIYATVEQSVARGKPGAKSIAAAWKATAQKKLEEARSHWERAIDEGARRADVYFEYAATLQETGAPEGDIAGALGRVVALNPRFTPANLWLAAIEGRRGRWPVAEKFLQAAATESPRRFEVWYELAFARHQQREYQTAREAAAKAVTLARTALEREKASALLTTGVADAVTQKPATAAKGWQLPEGDQQREADWTELVCGDVATLKMATGEEYVIRDPSKVTLQNAGGLSFDFACGKQDPPRRVRLRYDSATREVRRLELLPVQP
jgi:tetratricopeptide (TPR) repeat protein